MEREIEWKMGRERRKKRASEWSWWAIHIPSYSTIFRSRMICICYFISSEWCLEMKWSSSHLVECRINSLHSKLWYIAMNFIVNEANLPPYSLVWRIRSKMMGKECHIHMYTHTICVSNWKKIWRKTSLIIICYHFSSSWSDFSSTFLRMKMSCERTFFDTIFNHKTS